MDNTDQAQVLAPAAGSGVGKVIADSLIKQPDFLADMIQSARDGLRAMSPRRWDKDTETWIQDPDYRVRVQTFFGLLAHMEGDPVKRIIHEVRKGAGGSPDELLAESPAAIEAAKRIVAGAEARRRKAGLKKAEPVEVDVEA